MAIKNDDVKKVNIRVKKTAKSSEKKVSGGAKKKTAPDSISAQPLIDAVITTEKPSKPKKNSEIGYKEKRELVKKEIARLDSGSPRRTSQEKNLYPRFAEPVSQVPASPVSGDAVKPLGSESREKESNRPKKLSLGLYRKIAISFIILTIILVAIIFYFSFVKVTLVLTPRQERISSNLILSVYDTSGQAEAGGEALIGEVDIFEIEHGEKYPATGEEVIGEEATGKATIINNYTKSQPLVATTRLITPDGKLFRIKNTVNVPAGSSAEVDIYADEPSPEMAVGPTTFTIPGLWAGLQDKIYAQSSQPVVYRNKIKKTIRQSDIDGGVSDLKEKLLARAKEGIGEIYKDYSEVLYIIDDNSSDLKVSGKVGDEVEEFSMSMSTKVKVVAFNEDKVLEMAKSKFNSNLSGDRELAVFSKDDMTYTLENFDADKGTATVNATFAAKVTLNKDASIIDREKLTGLTRDQLEDYLRNTPQIEKYELEFSPAFINRVPNLADRIKIVIKNQ